MGSADYGSVPWTAPELLASACIYHMHDKLNQMTSTLLANLTYGLWDAWLLRCPAGEHPIMLSNGTRLTSLPT